MFLLFGLVLVLFLIKRSSLLLSLIILELLRFLALGCVFLRLSFSGSDYIALVLFSIFVIEGVIGVSGLISLVSFSGSDYMVVSSFSKC